MVKNTVHIVVWVVLAVSILTVEEANSRGANRSAVILTAGRSQQDTGATFSSIGRCQQDAGATFSSAGRSQQDAGATFSAEGEDYLVGIGLGALLESGELVEVVLTQPPLGKRVVYQQTYGGYPVLGGALIVRFDREGRIISHFNSLAAWKERPAVTISLDREAAVAEALRMTGNRPLRDDASAEVAILPRDGRPVAVWQVELPVAAPPADLEVLIDALTGGVLQVEDRLARIDGRGLIFDPDPKSALGTDTLRDEDDAADAIPEAAYRQVLLENLAQDDDGLYILRGPYVDATLSPDPARLESPDFLFDRSDRRFEQVMGYYHLDRYARYLIDVIELVDIVPQPQRIAANGVEDDMSFYSPFTGLITTGSGGVDDGEDADVWIHEYTHALIEAILPRWRGGDSGLMAEGLCDYFAGDRSRAVVPDFQPEWIYNWDGHNEFWGGRVLDADYTYPEDAGRERHDAGQLWSAFLTEIARSVENSDLWNSIVIGHLASLGDSVSVPDAAMALLSNELALAEGRYRRQILEPAERRGILPYGRFRPQITHQPTGDTEDLGGERILTVITTSGLPIANQGVRLIYGYDRMEVREIAFELLNRVEQLWQARLPLPEQEADVHYYLVAVDVTGVEGFAPPGAPENTYSFHVGPDRVPPEFVEVDSLYDTPFPVGSARFGARIIDNIGVSDVRLLWLTRDGEQSGEVILTRQEDDSSHFAGRLTWNLPRDGTLLYRLLARDRAAARNLAGLPFRAMNVRREAVIDDFERLNHRWLLDGWERDSTAVREGRFGLSDRIGRQNEQQIAIAELDEGWALAGFGRARLRFWEQHRYDIGSFGRIEVSQGEDEWTVLQYFQQRTEWWEQREINLDRYAVDNAAPIRVRFVSAIRPGAGLFWVLDRIELSLGVIVAADADSVEAAAEPALSLHPNPTNGRLTVIWHLPSTGHFEVIDLAGRSVRRLEADSGTGQASLDLERLPSGVYLAALSYSGTRMIRKFALVK